MTTEDMPREVLELNSIYPMISLARALKRVQQLRDANATYVATKPIKFYRIWGYAEDIGPARRTLSALTQFGLVDCTGQDNDKLVRLSALAHIIMGGDAYTPDERAMALQDAALKPVIFEYLMQCFGVALPPDSVVEEHLTSEYGYGVYSARALLRLYKETLHFAGINANTVETTPSEHFVVHPISAVPYSQDDYGRQERGAADCDIHIGDYVYYEIAGALQLGSEARVRAVDDRYGEKIVFVDEIETGFPADKVVLTQESNSLHGKIRFAARLLLQKQSAYYIPGSERASLMDRVGMID